MDIYDQITDAFSSIPCVSRWAELQTLFQRVASGRPAHWLLPVRACESVGGGADQAIPAVVVIACSHIGIVLVDDMLDADPRGEHQRVGAPAAANMACALQSAALASVSRCEMSRESKLTALEGINEMFLATTIGQYWDVQSLVMDEGAYWRIAQTKSSPFFGAALQIGALAGGASVNVAARVKELGSIYGEMIQIHDDLNDTMAVPANPDWTEGRSPLPILFARLVDHPARSRFEELYQSVKTDPQVLEEAQEILIQSGAVSYCVGQLLSRYQTVREILSTVAMARPSTLIALFEEAVMPVWKLFQAAGETPFD